MALAVFLPEISISILIPVVVVLKAAALSLPVSCEVCAALVVRNNPTSAYVWRTSPVTFVPLVMVSHRIPIPVDPNKFGCRSDRNSVNDARRRRWADADPDRDLRAEQ
jgi:hypothetical protein